MVPPKFNRAGTFCSIICVKAPKYFILFPALCFLVLIQLYTGIHHVHKLNFQSSLTLIDGMLDSLHLEGYQEKFLDEDSHLKRLYNSTVQFSSDEEDVFAEPEITCYESTNEVADLEAPPAVSMEDFETRQLFGIYPLCPRHKVVRENIFVKATPFVSPQSLPNIPFLRRRYIRMYAHWRLAVSRLRASLVRAGEPPYVINQSQESTCEESWFTKLLIQAVQSPGNTLLSSHADGKGCKEESGKSTWANVLRSFHGFCSFARTTSSNDSTETSPEPPKILLYDGSLVYQKMDGMSGPQGDIMQWSDLAIALHLIGYGLHVSFPLSYRPCPDIDSFDLIFSDYSGLGNSMCSIREKFRYGAPFPRRCKIRLLDLFGTEAPFNCKIKKLGKLKYYKYACLPSLRQYLTLQPDYAPENTFLGFASPLPSVTSRDWRLEAEADWKSRFPGLDPKDFCRPNEEKLLKDWRGLVWAKGSRYFNKVEIGSNIETGLYLKQISDRLPLIASADAAERRWVPEYVEISGKMLTPAQVSKKLMSLSVVVGLGLPLMASGILEAVGNPGLHFLNPLFDPKWTRRNNREMEGKPTSQGMPSQQPFLGKAMGPPFVYTLNINDPTAVNNTLRDVQQDFLKLQNMNVSSRNVEYSKRRRAILNAIEPYYSAESFMIRVHNIVKGYKDCFTAKDAPVSEGDSVFLNVKKETARGTKISCKNMLCHKFGTEHQKKSQLTVTGRIKKRKRMRMKAQMSKRKWKGLRLKGIANTKVNQYFNTIYS